MQLSQASAGDIWKLVEGILNKDFDNQNDPFSQFLSDSKPKKAEDEEMESEDDN